MIKEREDYALSAWLSDLVNILKKREWLSKREQAWEIINDDIIQILEFYQEGSSPIQCYDEYYKD